MRIDKKKKMWTSVPEECATNSVPIFQDPTSAIVILVSN